MKYKLTALTLIMAMSAIMISPGLAAAQAGNANGQAKKANSLALPISGTASGAPLTGTFHLQRFAAQEGKLVGIGTLVATVTDPTTGAVRNIVAGGLTMPVEATSVPAASGAQAQPVQIQAICNILHLELGPLDLDLLGLVVHLDRVVLDITAESGAGNLLGNLLCAIAGLLDPGTPGPLQQIIALLNQILQILGG
jgi:hypothetical protein